MADNKYNRIYDSIVAFAESISLKDQLDYYSLIYGYCKLLSIGQLVLDTMFDDKEEQEELKKIRAAIEVSKIDCNLVKQAMPFVINANVVSDSEVPDTEDHTPSEMFDIIMKKKLPELQVVQKGNSLDDVFRYIEMKKKENDKDRSEFKNEDEDEDAIHISLDDWLEESPSKEESSSDTGIVLYEKLVSKCKEVTAVLSSKIIGQDEAINVFVDGFFHSELMKIGENSSDSKPTTFLFAGPPGVGKTFLAVEAAKAIGLPYRKFDMSEFDDRETASNEFRGYPKSYSGAKPGEVTTYVKNNPHSVILFDEIEKANISVIHLFLQILDSGMLTDANTNKNISFADTIIIFTTNVGKELYEGEHSDNLSSLPTNVVMKAIEDECDQYGEKMFPKAICSRFANGNVVMMNHLSFTDLNHIYQSVLDKEIKSIKDNLGFEISYDSKMITMLLLSLGDGLDARTVTGHSAKFIREELYEIGRHLPDTSRLGNIKRISFIVDDTDLPAEIKPFISKKIDSKILIAGDKKKWDNVPFSSSNIVVFAENTEKLEYLLQNEDFSIIIIDPFFNTGKQEKKYLSLDDFGSEGIRMFNFARSLALDMPVYMMVSDDMSAEDKVTFKRMGIKGFIDASDKADLADNINSLADMCYLQNKASELSGRGKVLTYNISEELSENGDEILIRLYDFHMNLAVRAEDRDAVMLETEAPSTRFTDIIGADSAKNELRECLRYLKNPKQYIASGNQPPKGILLYGPPGTGKTMLARAMAGEANATFLPTTGSSFESRYVGESEENVRRLFRRARQYAPSIIFIDEIDAIGKERTGSDYTAYRESILNTLLTEMDGFKVNPSRPVFVLAATNYDIDSSRTNKASALDPALVRRFSNRILVDLPDQDARKEFLMLKLGNESGVSNDTIDNIASRTTGESLAIINNVIDLARRNASKLSKELDDQILLDALEEYMYGEKHTWDEEYYRHVAVHESGHAYLCMISGINKPNFLTIVSRGDFGGYMQHDSSEGIPSYNREQMLARIRIALAGRASEICFFGEEEGINTGISSDLTNATNIAVSMLCRYGMQEGSMVSLDPSKVISTPIYEEIIKAADSLIKEQMEITMREIESGKDKISRLAEALMEKNQLTGPEIETILSE